MAAECEGAQHVRRQSYSMMPSVEDYREIVCNRFESNVGEPQVVDSSTDRSERSPVSKDSGLAQQKAAEDCGGDQDQDGESGSRKSRGSKAAQEGDELAGSASKLATRASRSPTPLLLLLHLTLNLLPCALHQPRMGFLNGRRPTPTT